MRVLEVAGGVMEEMASPSGPRKELVNSHCNEFMQLVKVLLFFCSFQAIVFDYNLWGEEILGILNFMEVYEQLLLSFLFNLFK